MRAAGPHADAGLFAQTDDGGLPASASVLRVCRAPAPVPFGAEVVPAHTRSAQSLGVRSGRTVAVRDVSFQMEPPAIFGLSGPNGADKTRTLDVAEGFLRARAGEVRVLGIAPRREPCQARARIEQVSPKSSSPAARSAHTACGKEKAPRCVSAIPWGPLLSLERETGFEPATLCMASKCSTPELLPRSV